MPAELAPGQARSLGWNIQMRCLASSSLSPQRVLPVSSNDAMLSGQLFVPMHWSSAFVGSAGSNALTAAKIDRKSFQPELKHVAVRVDKIDLAWQCAAVSACGDPVRALTALRPLLAECRFASATLLDGERPAVRVRFAHEALPAADCL